MWQRSLLAILTVTLAGITQAQPLRSPQEVEQVFQDALDAFESGKYTDAYAGFKDIYLQLPLNRRTTAAYVMAAKSLYRNAEYRAAIELLDEFRAQYPKSRYVEDSEHLIAAAELGLARIQRDARAIRLGLALPLSVRDSKVTRSIFQGILLAVDTHNRRSASKIKIIFRDTGDSAEEARSAVTSLMEEGVSVIIGPLSSEQVDAAAVMTEPQKIVLIAPLATGSRLTEGRNYVFQVNITLLERGRAIAREVIEHLDWTDIGILMQADREESREMAKGFMEVLSENGLNPVFVHTVPSDSDWLRLSELIDFDLLSAAQAFYFSVYHDDGVRGVAGLIQDGVSSIFAKGLRVNILSPLVLRSLNLDRLGAGVTAYYVDAYYDRDERVKVRRFIGDYKASNRGAVPDRFAFIGYDVANMLLENLGRRGSLADDLLGSPRYEGVGMRIQFEESHHNTAMYIFKYSSGEPQLRR